MTVTPTPVTDHRFPENLRNAFRDVWESQPAYEYRQESVPPSEWKNRLENSYTCMVIRDFSRPVLVAMSGGYTDMAHADAPADLQCFKGRRMFALSFERVGLSEHMPAVGEVLSVSASGSDGIPWLDMISAYLSGMGDVPVQTVPALMQMGLTFSGEFLQEAQYWVASRVLQVIPHDDACEVLAEIESVTENFALDDTQDQER